MHALTTPLAKAEVAIFAISAWNTDFVLIHEADGEKATAVLRHDGWSVSVENEQP